MFGQQPQQQYGYPQQGYPQQQAYSQQQYGGYQPAPMAPKMSAEQMLNQIDSQPGKSAFTKDIMPGTRVTGIIENVTANQVRDFQTKQPAFWNDGSPRLQVLVTIDTGIIDPNVEDDDGRRTVYIKGWGVQRRAWLQALHNAGLKKAGEVKPGDRFTATFTGYGPQGNLPQPPKLFEYVIEHQSPADLAMGQPQQPAQQPFQQQPQQKVTRSSSTPHSRRHRPRIRGISRPQPTRGTRPHSRASSNLFSLCSSASSRWIQ
ncbi:hypothetical protein ABKP74_04415 [Bifidobacterium breve]|uniref:hypothetical protein n=1 Tax=Bifidobacterium breve TaxID=1685 RepID=UPI0032DF3D3B